MKDIKETIIKELNYHPNLDLTELNNLAKDQTILITAVINDNIVKYRYIVKMKPIVTDNNNLPLYPIYYKVIKSYTSNGIDMDTFEVEHYNSISRLKEELNNTNPTKLIITKVNVVKAASPLMVIGNSYS